VESGLAAGDRVIVEGLQKISPGVPVQPVDARPAPDPAPSANAASQP
jgi:membrane fusion protein (multidrug efflux system)